MPIIPEFLYDIRHPDAPLDSFPRTPLTTPRTPLPCDGIAVLTTENALQNDINAAGELCDQMLRSTMPELIGTMF